MQLRFKKAYACSSQESRSFGFFCIYMLRQVLREFTCTSFISRAGDGNRKSMWKKHSQRYFRDKWLISEKYRQFYLIIEKKTFLIDRHLSKTVQVTFSTANF